VAKVNIFYEHPKKKFLLSCNYHISAYYCHELLIVIIFISRKTDQL